MKHVFSITFYNEAINLRPVPIVEDNSVKPDQTAPKEQSDLGLHCLSVIKNFHLIKH